MEPSFVAIRWSPHPADDTSFGGYQCELKKSSPIQLTARGRRPPGSMIGLRFMAFGLCSAIWQLPALGTAEGLVKQLEKRVKGMAASDAGHAHNSEVETSLVQRAMVYLHFLESRRFALHDRGGWPRSL